MRRLFVFNHKKKVVEEEEIYGRPWFVLFFSEGKWAPYFRKLVLPILVSRPWFSAFYGWIQKKSFTRAKIKPFIKKFSLDPDEFASPLEGFASFNDFFIRKLKPEARPIDQRSHVLVAPCDGRFHVIQNISCHTSFILKDTLFDLEKLLQNPEWVKKYQGGSMVMARLCPFDYHRFHFPCDAKVVEMESIGEMLHSVNPLAVEVLKTVYWENKRFLTLMTTERFKDVMMIEVGATNVGTIHETFTKEKVVKGEEKGYFSFGGSAILLLFEPKAVAFEPHLIEYSAKGMEVRLEMGNPLGFSLS